MTLPQLRLDNQLCFLLHRITREVNAAYRPLLDDLGVTYPQYLVLLILWEQDGQTVSDLGRRLSLDSATLSPLLRRLEAAGLVTRTRHAQDERRVTIALTAQGRALEQRAADIPAELARTMSADHAEYLDLRARLEALLQRVGAQRDQGHVAVQDHAAESPIPADSRSA